MPVGGRNSTPPCGPVMPASGPITTSSSPARRVPTQREAGPASPWQYQVHVQLAPVRAHRPHGVGADGVAQVVGQRPPPGVPVRAVRQGRPVRRRAAAAPA